MVERGVILAGGMGTRLKEVSGTKNKHLVDVAGRPMLDYPLDTLKDQGIEKVTVVTNPHDAMSIVDHLQGRRREFNFDIRFQPYPNGMADALGCAVVKEDVFVVLCGDTYHDPAPKLDGGVQLWWTKQEAGNHGAVWVPAEKRIVEKPPAHLARLAIIGARVYDQAAMRMIDHLQPSDRGELELVDIDNWYLSNELEMTHYGGFFGDMGTPEGLKRVEDHIYEN